MPSRRKPKPAARAKTREGARKPRKQQARKSADRPLRRAAPSAPGLLPEMARHRDRRAVLPPASQAEPVTPLSCGRCTSTRKSVLANTWRGSSSSRKILRAQQQSISSGSLRDVQNVLRSLYRGLIQLKRHPDDENPYPANGCAGRHPRGRRRRCGGRRRAEGVGAPPTVPTWAMAKAGESATANIAGMINRAISTAPMPPPRRK